MKKISNEIVENDIKATVGNSLSFINTDSQTSSVNIQTKNLVVIANSEIHDGIHFHTSNTQQELLDTSSFYEGSPLPTAFEHLIGRENELLKLTQAYENGTNVFAIIALGGFGKTALVKEWLHSLADESLHTYDSIYIWSFYAQGLSIGNASSDAFFKDALTFFGDANPDNGTITQKANRLARLVSCRKIILVLDGIEVFQLPPGINAGRIQDEALHVFLRSIANNNLGLCVITSRISFPQLLEYKRSSKYVELNLEGLCEPDGVSYLRSLGVKGGESKLRNVVHYFKGHCLSLMLCASLITTVYDGNISSYRLIPNPLTVQNESASHANNILKCYVEWLHLNDNVAYLEILNILALFDRPIDDECFRYVYKNSNSSGLQFTSVLANFSSNNISLAITKLTEARLMFVSNNGIHRTFDTHPIIRAFFSSRLKCEHNDLWRIGCELVFCYLDRQLPKEPVNFDDEDKLLRAIMYGTEYQEINTLLKEEFFDRAMKKEEYATNQLSMYGAVLSTLKAFYFEGDLNRINTNLSVPNKMYVYVETGYLLTAVMGYASSDAEYCFSEAINLASLYKEYDLRNLYIKALLGLCRYYRMIGDLQENKRVSEEILLIAENEQFYLPIARRALCTYYFYSGDFINCIYEASECKKYNTKAEGLMLAYADLNEPYLSCLGYTCMAKLLNGDPSDIDDIDNVVSEAFDFNHAHTIVVVLLMKLMMSQFTNNYHEIILYADKMIEVCSTNGFNQWECSAKILLYWAKIAIDNNSESIQLLKYEVELWESFGAKLFLPYWYYLLSDAYNRLEQADDVINFKNKAIEIENITNERWAHNLF